jgi:predicted dehydrogenase
MIRLGIIGIGHLGKLHLKIFSTMSPIVMVTDICDIKVHPTQKIAKEYAVNYSVHYQDLLGKVDAVSVCVPTEVHHEVASFFLRNGIHVFLEKPIARTIEEADDLIRLRHQHNVILQIGHIERFNSAFQAIRDITINPLFIECHRLNHFPNRSLDIGVVMDLMIHDIDIISGIVPSSVENISAVGVNVLTPLEDIANARLHFKNGCVCNLTASRVSDDVMRKIRIFQKDTYISLDYVKQDAFVYRRIHGEIIKKPLPIEKEQPLQTELTHFIECILSGQNPMVSGTDGRNALAIALKISEEIWTNLKKNELHPHQHPSTIPIP